jgi:hypothetical protein
MVLTYEKVYRVSGLENIPIQYLTQIDEQVRDAVLGNVGTMICFRVGPSDAEILAREFYQEFSLTDLTNLPNYHIYLKLMIDGVVSRPFSAVGLKRKESSS